MGVLLVVGGRLGDRCGKRHMFLVGMAGFTLASVWCGLAADPAMLIVGRLVQGGFGALLIPQGIGILLGALSREQLPRAFGVFGPVMGASAILGPIVAGFIISAGMLSLIYGLIEGSTAGWTAVPIGCLAAGAVLLAAFGVRQRMAADPLILPSLLANRGFTVGLLLGLAFFAAVNGLASAAWSAPWPAPPAPGPRSWPRAPGSACG